MNAFKIMRAKYYKLGSSVQTTNANYGNRTARVRANQGLADEAILVCSESNATFEQMITFLQMLQSPLAQIKLPPQVTNTHAERLNVLAQLAPPIVDDFGGTFWESLYERVRQQERPSCPSRVKSYFASRDVDSLRRYRNDHWGDKMGDKMACAIDVSGCTVAFEADMVILDKVDGDMTFETARPHILRYWDQEMSSNPNVEVLLQGTVVLGERITL